MEYLIVHKNEPIGKVVEPEADLGMGVITGSFVPFPRYENVRTVCQLSSEFLVYKQADGEKTRSYHQEYGALHLSLTTMSGLPVETLWIYILDFSKDLGDNGYEAHFCVDYVDGTFFASSSLWEQKRS